MGGRGGRGVGVGGRGREGGREGRREDGDGEMRVRGRGHTISMDV